MILWNTLDQLNYKHKAVWYLCPKYTVRYEKKLITCTPNSRCQTTRAANESHVGFRIITSILKEIGNQHANTKLQLQFTNIFIYSNSLTVYVLNMHYTCNTWIIQEAGNSKLLPTSFWTVRQLAITLQWITRHRGSDRFKCLLLIFSNIINHSYASNFKWNLLITQHLKII